MRDVIVMNGNFGEKNVQKLHAKASLCETFKCGWDSFVECNLLMQMSKWSHFRNQFIRTSLCAKTAYLHVTFYFITVLADRCSLNFFTFSVNFLFRNLEFWKYLWFILIYIGKVFKDIIIIFFLYIIIHINWSRHYRKDII